MSDQTFPLSEMAQRMYMRARQFGKTSWQWSDGLYVGLYRDDSCWMVLLMRDDVPPSEAEISTARCDFCIPAIAVEARTNRVVTLTWHQRDVLAAAEVAAPGGQLVLF